MSNFSLKPILSILVKCNENLASLVVFCIADVMLLSATGMEMQLAVPQPLPYFYSPPERWTNIQGGNKSDWDHHSTERCKIIPAKLREFQPIFPKMADLAGCGRLLLLAEL